MPAFAKVFPELSQKFDFDVNIESVRINRSQHTMTIVLERNPNLTTDATDRIKSDISRLYNLDKVTLVVEKQDDQSKKQKPQVIYNKDSSGKPFDTADITTDSGRVGLSGQIFDLSAQDIWGGRRLIKFNIHDKSSSMSCKLVDNPKVCAPIEEHLKNGLYLHIKGEAQYDKYTKEAVVQVSYLETAPAPQPRQDTAPEKRVELHLHTQMSAMDALSPAQNLVERAIAWGHPAIAVTDHGIVQAFPFAHEAAKKHPEFKVIYGVEGYLTEDFSEDQDNKKLMRHHVTILAQTSQGLFNLYNIISESHLNAFFQKPRIQKSLLAKYREGLLVGSACELGEVFHAMVNGASDSDLENLAELYDYLEIMPIENNAFMLRNGQANSEEDLKNFNRRIVALGERLGKPVIATCDVHFLDPEDAVYRAILQAGQGYSDADNQAPLYLRTTEEMLQEFDYLGEEKAYEVVVTNSRLIADKIDKIKPIPDGTFPPEMDDAEQTITKMCQNKAREIYGDPLPERVSERMEGELQKITKYGFSVMYLIAQKLVSKSLADGYLVGSRGSVGSSFVAYLCGITEVNSLAPHYVCPNCHHSDFITDGSVGCGIDLPSKSCPQCDSPYHADGHDIPFETFLGFEGDKEPDIDLNFSGEYQPIAHKYVEELFGEGYVFRAGTINTMARKTAYGFVKKYLDERGKTLHSAEESRLVGGCIGVKRTTGQHPGGLMILPKGHDIHEFCPVQHPADDKTKNTITTHFDYHSISGRLLKLDILGHDDPTMIRMLEDLTHLDAKTIPLNDPDTMQIFLSTKSLGVTPKDINSEVGTLGVPEFGTRFVRQMLVETKPTTFSELVRISGLSHGTNVWINNAQALIKDGCATLSQAICTRDDIMTYLIYHGLPSKNAFDIMERVRKGKKLRGEDEDLMREHKIPEWYLDSCNKIEYMFPKAHAVAYVTMAFRIAYYKVHQKKAFYTAYLSVRADEFDGSIMMDPIKVKAEIERLSANETTLNQKDKNVLTILQIVREMFARGETFLPIDLYKSDVTRFKSEPDGIRPPLIALPGLGENAARAIDVARQEEPFSSKEDLRTRGKVNKTVVELMDAQGVLEDLPESNQLSFF